MPEEGTICELCNSPDLCEVCFGRDAAPCHDSTVQPFNDSTDNAGEPAVWFVLKESEARKIVAAADNGWAYQVVDILKRQPWWPEICAAVRGLRHLKPLGYIKEFGSGPSSAG